MFVPNGNFEGIFTTCVFGSCMFGTSGSWKFVSVQLVYYYEKVY